MTRHAKNRARFVGVTLPEIERVIDDPLYVEIDANGKPLYIGDLRGVRVRIVVALDEPDLIVTIHETRQ